MKKTVLEKKVARLESVNDHLMAELIYVNKLMQSIGFTYGLESVKAVAKEILHEQIEDQEEL